MTLSWTLALVNHITRDIPKVRAESRYIIWPALATVIMMSLGTYADMLIGLGCVCVCVCVCVLVRVCLFISGGQLSIFCCTQSMNSSRRSSWYWVRIVRKSFLKGLHKWWLGRSLTVLSGLEYWFIITKCCTQCSQSMFYLGFLLKVSNSICQEKEKRMFPSVNSVLKSIYSYIYTTITNNIQK